MEFPINKYSKWYFSIINNARLREEKNIGDERHHIIPKCLGGSNKAQNIVNLKPREHMICHWLLVRIFPSINGLKFAFWRMTLKNDHQTRSFSTRTYEIARKYNAEASIIRNSNRIYERGRTCWHSPTTHHHVISYNCPPGYVSGYSPERKNTFIGKNAGKRYYHDPVNKHTITIGPHDTPPKNYIPGNPSARKGHDKLIAKIKSTTYYHDPINHIENRLDQCPDGWIKGRLVRWITNGQISQLHNRYVPIPNGYRLGRK